MAKETIHHWVVSYNSKKNEFYWDGDIENDVFKQVGGTILEVETGKFNWSGSFLESGYTNPDDDKVYSTEEKAMAVLLNAINLLNELIKEED